MTAGEAGVPARASLGGPFPPSQAVTATDGAVEWDASPVRAPEGALSAELAAPLHSQVGTMRVRQLEEAKQESGPYYVGNKHTYVFHKPSCPLSNKVPEKNKIIFRTRADPISIGYMPCKKCKP